MVVSDIEDLDKNLCKFYEGFQSKHEQYSFPKGIYTLDDLKVLGENTTMCPYFLARHFLLKANVIVFNYSYMLDPKISNMVSAELQKECVVVFDECHNIDNACIEAFSLNINSKILNLASTNIKKLEDRVVQIKSSNNQRLTDEYKKLVSGLNFKHLGISEDELLSHPLLKNDTLQEAIPGSIRKAEHFLSFMRRVIVCLKEELNSKEVKIQTPLQILFNLQAKGFIDQRSLKFAHDRLQSLLNTLEIGNIDEFSPLNIIADFATLISTYYKGFSIIVEPYPEDNLIYDPRL